MANMTTRYYYDGPNVIEERNGSDARVRYHVNGSQFMDERVASFEDGSGAFTYYLMKENFSVVGMGNADGSTIKRLDYSSTGSFTGGGIGGGGVDVDYNNDGYVDASDVAAFMACMSGPGIPQNNPACAGMKLDGNDTVDMDDFAIIQRCYSPSPIKALPECVGQGGGSLTTGTFAMHGRPIDVINDPVSNQPLVLQDFRARTYLPQYGRWLQRDGLGNVDGPNLYEAFKGNSLSNVDPRGTDIWVTTELRRSMVGDVPVWGVYYYGHRNGLDLGLGGLADPSLIDRQLVSKDYFPTTLNTGEMLGIVESNRKLYEDYFKAHRDVQFYEGAVRVAVTAAVAIPTASIGGPVVAEAFSTTTTTATGTTVLTTTTLGNTIATGATMGVSLGSGSAAAEIVLGSDAKQVARAAAGGILIGSVTGGALGAAMPTGTFVVATDPIAARGGLGAIGLDRVPGGPMSNELEALYFQRASSSSFKAKLWVNNQFAGVAGGRTVSVAEITEALAKAEFRQAGLLSSSVRLTDQGFLIGGSTRGGYFASEIADHELLHLGQFLRTPGINTGFPMGLVHEVIPSYVGSPVIYIGGTTAIVGGAYGTYQAVGGSK